jgi:hypothetical protein
MATEPPRALILAPAGPVRDGLLALFSAVAGLRAGAEPGTLDEALRRLAAAPPELVIVDAALLQPGLRVALDRVRATAPRAACLLLVDELPPGASALAADVVLLKGAPAAELVSTALGLVGRR